MNDDLPAPKPRLFGSKTATDTDVRAMIKGLTPGWYTTSDLLPRYEAWCRREGRTPGSGQALGMALRRIVPEFGHVHGHARSWRITEELTQDTVSEMPS